MLVLSRHVNERILIYANGEEIMRIVVTEAHGNKVRLGFSAPREYSILREELTPEGRQRGPQDQS